MITIQKQYKILHLIKYSKEIVAVKTSFQFLLVDPGLANARVKT